MVRADFITALVLMCLGLGTLVLSLQMPRFTDSGASPYSAPGLVPGMIGVAIAVLGGILCLRSTAALRAGAQTEEGASERGWIRALGALALCGVYAIGLVGRVPFWLATFLFVLAFILGFEFSDPEMRTQVGRRIVVGIVIATAVSAVVSYVFQEIFLVRLP
jgi:putative tricarboxylic transport membrane protein